MMCSQVTGPGHFAPVQLAMPGTTQEGHQDGHEDSGPTLSSVVSREDNVPEGDRKPAAKESSQPSSPDEPSANGNPAKEMTASQAVKPSVANQDSNDDDVEVVNVVQPEEGKNSNKGKSAGNESDTSGEFHSDDEDKDPSYNAEEGDKQEKASPRVRKGKRKMEDTVTPKKKPYLEEPLFPPSSDEED